MMHYEHGTGTGLGPNVLAIVLAILIAATPIAAVLIAALNRCNLADSAAPDLLLRAERLRAARFAGGEPDLGRCEQCPRTPRSAPR